MKLSTKIILPIIIISALLILLNGCFGVPADESPGFTPGTISGIIAAPCCPTSAESADGETTSPEYWCYYCEKEWKLQDGVEVILTYGEDEVATTTTNENGEFTFTNVDPGKNYVVTAYCPDYDDDRPLVKDVALELVEGGSFDTKTTDIVSTSLGLVVDFLVDFTILGPEDIVLDDVIADKPDFPNFPKFKDLIYEVVRVLEACQDVNADDDLQYALCLAAEEISGLTIGCGPGFTPPPPPPPNPCADNIPPVVNEVTLNTTAISSPSTQDLVVGTSYTVVINASDDNILPKPANPLTYSLTITKGTDPSFDIDMGTTNTFTGTPLVGDVGTYTVYVNVNDGCTTTTWGPVTVEVHDECFGNDGPFLAMPANVIVDPDLGPYTWSVVGSDPDGIKDPLSYSLVSVVPTLINGFTVNPTSGEISWDPDCNDVIGRVNTVYTVTVEVYDGCDTDEGSFDVTLNADPCECFGNDGPFLAMPANVIVDPDLGPYTWSVVGSDPDGIKDPLSYSLVSVVPTPINGFTVNPTSGEISWDPDCNDVIGRVNTVYTVTVEVYDGCDTDEGSFDVTLNADPCECFGNDGPFLAMPANVIVDPDLGPYTWSVVGSDPDGIKDPLSYSLVSVVPTPINGFTVNPTSGEISWDPDCNDVIGRVNTVYTVTVEVYDGCDTDEGSFDVTLNADPCECFGNDGPFLAMPANVIVDPDLGPYTWSVVGSDPDGIKDPLSYSLVSVVPTPINGFTVNPTSGEISWDPDCNDVIGRVNTVYTVTVEVYDGCDTDEGSFDVTLNADPCECFGNDGPFLAMPANVIVDPDLGPYTWSVVGSDPDGIKDPLSYSLVSVVPTPINGFTVNPTSGEISWDPDCNDVIGRVNTVYTVTVEVYDGCDTDEGSFDVTLNADPCEPCELAELTIFTNKVPDGYVIDVSEFTFNVANDAYEYEYRIDNEDNSLTFIPILSGNCEGVVHYQWKNEGCVGGIYVPAVPAEANTNVEYPTADVVPSKKFVVCNPPDYNILYLYVGEGTEQDIYKVIVRREDAI